MPETLYVGTRKGLFGFARRTGQSSGWAIKSVHFLGEPVTMLLPDAGDGSLLVALNLGHFGVKLHRSRDGGESWQEVPAPTYPPQPDGAKSATNAPWSLIQIWSLEAGGPDQPGKLWAGTIPGGLFRSNDAGDSWSLVRSLWDRPERAQWFGGGYDHPGIHSICVDPRDSRRVTVAVSSGGVWQSDDDGDSWQPRCTGMSADYVPEALREDPNVQDPHRLVQSASDPDVMWLQHHCGIYCSSDRAASWQRLEARPSSFGFALAVHPRKAQQAWFVPAARDACRVPVNARLAVSRTRDGGASFERLDQGLPQCDAYDLIYRHGLDVDPSGHCLAMGSTSGNLWLSEDGGERWRALSTHLPPINCVRFATDSAVTS